MNNQDILIGLKHHQAGDLESAKTIYQNIIQVKSNHADALHLLGVVNYQQGFIKESISLIKKALEYNQSPEYLSNLGNAYQKIKEYRCAELNFEKAIKLNPDYFDCVFNLGNLYLETAQYCKAIDNFMKCLNMTPESVDVRINLAKSYLLNNMYSEAETLYLELLDVKPVSSGVYNHVGIFYSNLGKHALALKYFDSAIAVMPGESEYLSNKASSLMALGKVDEALLFYKKALKRNPKNVLALYNLGIFYLSNRHYKRSEVCFSRLLREGQYVVESTIQIALMNKVHNNKKSIELMDGLYRRYPEDAKIIHSFVNVMLFSDNNNYELIIRLLNKAISLEPENLEYQFTLSKVRLMLEECEGNWDMFYLLSREMSGKTGCEYWNGKDDLSKKKVAILFPDSLGDVYFGLRFLYAFSDKCKMVYLKIPNRVQSLVRDTYHNVHVIEKVESLDVDCVILGNEIYGHLWSSGREFPKLPMLKINSKLKESLLLRYKEKFRYKKIIGVSWKSLNPDQGELHSVELQEIVKILSEINNVQLVSIQYGDTVKEEEMFKNIYFDASIDQSGDASILATQFSILDAVVSIDTAALYLAAGLGLKTCGLLPLFSNWKWFLNTSDSIWYDNLKIFRQTQINNWDAPLENMRDYLLCQLFDNNLDKRVDNDK